MLENRMTIPCLLYSQETDGYGDLRKINPIATTCWFREIDLLAQTPNREASDSDAMAWLPPGTEAEKGDLLDVNGNTYRITNAVYARRIGTDKVWFIKCSLKFQSGTVS